MKNRSGQNKPDSKKERTAKEIIIEKNRRKNTEQHNFQDGPYKERIAVNIAGAGLAGLSAALTLAEQGLCCNLISVQPSERAQSVMAEGGMNAALNTMGEADEPRCHFEDTMKGGAYLADPNAVKGLTDTAPAIIRRLHAIGVPFQMKGQDLVLRPFGGQKKKRTAYAMSSTGKVVMTALIDEARKYEAAGLIRRCSHMEIQKAEIKNGRCVGIWGRDTFTDERRFFPGPVILCSGGLNGLFNGMTTGTTANTGSLAASLFAEGVKMGNLEMIQYHPTTAAISGKRMLISEAARGEGGRLFIYRKSSVSPHGEAWYFMEEKYPELGNLMPRDVVSKEIYTVAHDPDLEGQVYLDMRHLKKETWVGKLSDLRREVIHYLNLDPAKEPIPISPGIHFFMGGILVDEQHKTNIENLWAAGESACQYHGANRLGGNSMIAAIYGGHVAALDAAEQQKIGKCQFESKMPGEEKGSEAAAIFGTSTASGAASALKDSVIQKKLTEALVEGLGIYRNNESLQKALKILENLKEQTSSTVERQRILLGEAMVLSALERRESRGAHARTDFPERDDTNFRRTTAAEYDGDKIRITFQTLPELRKG